MPTEIKAGLIIIPLTIALGIFLVFTAHKESDKNLERAELFLSNTWDAPYEIDNNHMSRNSVIFYSKGQRYEIDTLDWSVER